MAQGCGCQYAYILECPGHCFNCGAISHPFVYEAVRQVQIRRTRILQLLERETAQERRSAVSVPSYEDSNSCSRKTAYQAPDRFVAQRKYILRMEQSKEIDLPT